MEIDTGWGDSDSGNNDETQTGQSADAQLAKKLVRYALACEFSRTPIRRDGIKERGQPCLMRVVAWLHFADKRYPKSLALRAGHLEESSP